MKNRLAWLTQLVPPPVNASKREKLYGCIGACIGIVFTDWVSKTVLGDLNPWFIAPMGASAVLLFAVPSSPLAQPWNIIGGNLVSVLIGITCVKLIGAPVLAAAAAAALAVGAMLALRCVHPPSGAVALTAVLGGKTVLASGYHFALQPVAINTLFLVFAALVFNNLLRRRYPHPVAAPAKQAATEKQPPGERLGFTRADLDASLRIRNELLDIDSDDLEEILEHAALHAFERRSGEILCADIMSKDVVVAHPGLPAAPAWKLLEEHRIHALPVVDGEKILVGIVTLHDLVEMRDDHLPGHAGLPRLKQAQRLEEVMTRKVQTVSPDAPVSKLVSSFADGGFLHLPVVDAHCRVVGMVTRSDMIAALYRIGLEGEAKSAPPTGAAGGSNLVRFGKR